MGSCLIAVTILRNHKLECMSKTNIPNVLEGWKGKHFMKDLFRGDRLRIKTDDVIVSATEMHYPSFIWMLFSDACILYDVFFSNSMKVQKVPVKQ